MRTETCLWVIDTRKANARSRSMRKLDPETFRCRIGGVVFCQPCFDRFRADPRTAASFPVPGT